MFQEFCFDSNGALVLVSTTLVAGDILVDVVTALNLLPSVFLEGWWLAVDEGMVGECSTAVGDGEGLGGCTELEAVSLGKAAACIEK